MMVSDKTEISREMIEAGVDALLQYESDQIYEDARHVVMSVWHAMREVQDKE